MITSWDGYTVVNVGEMEIWDGSELSLLRDTMTRLVEEENCRSLGVDMSHVKGLPSGYFGMLYDWYEKGVGIRVFGALPHVQQMLWFTTFFYSVGNECHELSSDLGCEAAKQLSERDSQHEPQTTADSALPTQDPREADIPCPDAGRASLSERASILSQ